MLHTVTKRWSELAAAFFNGSNEVLFFSCLSAGPRADEKDENDHIGHVSRQMIQVLHRNLHCSDHNGIATKDDTVRKAGFKSLPTGLHIQYTGLQHLTSKDDTTPTPHTVQNVLVIGTRFHLVMSLILVDRVLHVKSGDLNANLGNQ